MAEKLMKDESLGGLQCIQIKCEEREGDVVRETQREGYLGPKVKVRVDQD